MEFLDETPEVEPIDGPVRPGAVRIILADSQAIYRVGIRKIFALEDDLRVVAQADSLDNLKAAIERYPTDVVLLEGGLLAGNPNAIPDLLKIAPDVKLIVQAISADESQTVELYRRGVRVIISRLNRCRPGAMSLRSLVTASHCWRSAKATRLSRSSRRPPARCAYP